MEQLPKIEGISPEMLWTFLVVLVGLAGLFVLGYKVIDIIRKEHERKVAKNKLNKQDITDQIADKVTDKVLVVLKPDLQSLNDKVSDLDKRLSNDSDLLASHTRQLNDHENRVSQLEGGNKALCHGMLALLEQNPALVTEQNAMKNYLIDGRYNEEDWKK